MIAGRSRPETGAAGGPARHLPVMLREVVSSLKPKDGGKYIDATFGAGGHTRALLAAAGYPKADIIAWLTRKLAPAPAVVADPVVAFFSDALDGAASVTSAPEGPVSAAAVIMAGIMNPASIGELMGLSRD